MSGPNATAERGPYGPGELNIPKANGRIMVQGPIARGEEVRVVHGVEGGDVESLTLVADYYTKRTDGQPTTDDDRDRARQSVVEHAESMVPPGGAILNPFADSLVLGKDVPRTTGSRKGTESNNAMVWDNSSAGKWVKAANLKAQEAHRKRKAKDPAQNSRDQGEAGKIGGADRGSKKGRSDHERGGAGVRRAITLGQLLRTRPESIATSLAYFKCPKGCGRVDTVEDRWFFHVGQKEWRCVGPVCQLRKVHPVAKMVPCLDAEGKKEYGAAEMKALPFFGNKAATVVVQNNQGAYAVWLKDEVARLEEEKRYLEYGTETESGIEFDD